jgi:SAM-dependent methyltransferase
MKYPDVPNLDLLAKIPLTARSVLDVGCGGGATLAAYRQRNPRARLYGIEADVNAANLAMTRLDEVAIVDVEQMAQPFGWQRFDCIIYGDSLEHLRDPWWLLANHAGLLNPGGVIAICVPNVEHWSFVHRLLTASFDYQDNGLLDLSHLRWFTIDTMQAALRKAGLFPLDVMGRVFDADAATEFANALAPALTALGVDPDTYRRRATPLQFIWRATPAEVERMEVVSTMLEPVGGVSHLRVIHPMNALATAPDFGSHVLRDRKIARNLGDTPRIYIFHRPCLTEEHDLPMLRELLAEGYVVVCEFDDHPDYLQVLQRPDILNFTGVHAVQTTTPALAAVLGERNPEVGVFANAINELRPPRNFTNHQRLTMQFGGINREHEWPDLMPALNEVLQEAGDRLFMRVVGDQGFFDALQTPHKEFFPICDYDTYLNLLADSELCLMPLRDHPFNHCKSDLKFIEAAAARVLSIASPVVYGDSIVSGQTGWVFHSNIDFQAQLRAVLADPWHAMAMADSARQYVRAYRMQAYQMAARQNWYRSLWERREALTEALYNRVPTLRPVSV